MTVVTYDRRKFQSNDVRLRIVHWYTLDAIAEGTTVIPAMRKCSSIFGRKYLVMVRRERTMGQGGSSLLMT